MTVGREPPLPPAALPPYTHHDGLVIHGPVGKVCSLRDVTIDANGHLTIRVDVWPPTTPAQAAQATVLYPGLGEIERVTSAEVAWFLATPNGDGTFSTGEVAGFPVDASGDGWHHFTTSFAPPPPATAR